MSAVSDEIRAEERAKVIIESVREGDYSAERGAQKLGITVEDFMKLMEATPVQ